MENHAEACVYRHLTHIEVRFLDAVVARLVPDDELGPGAREAGVTSFIDQQLASSWGTSGRNYMAGPWLEGTPQQGPQLRLTPQDLFRAAIPEIEAHCREGHGTRFDLLQPQQQDAILQNLEGGTIELNSVDARAFFNVLLRIVLEGFFADPIYGGNRDKIGWKLIGFPGVAAADYTTHMENYNVPYRVEPVSIQDVERARVKVDAQGYPKHRKIKQSGTERAQED